MQISLSDENNKEGGKRSERMDEEIKGKTKPTFGQHWIRNAALSRSNPFRRSEM